MSAKDPAIERLRFCFARQARFYENDAHTEDEATTGLADNAIHAISGKLNWRGNALSCEQVVEATKVLPPDLRALFLNLLRHKTEAEWREDLIVPMGLVYPSNPPSPPPVPPLGSPVPRYSAEDIRAAMSLRHHLQTHGEG